MFKSYIIFFCFLISSCSGNSQKNEVPTSKKVNTEQQYKVTKTEAEWAKELTQIQFYILRQSGTERPFTSEWLDNKEKGTYVCAACNTELFKSEHKFDSGTGWPSFDREIKGNVAYDIDYKIGYGRTEEHCATCGGHLGHVFNDGPYPTGKRHCINGAALKFIPG